MSIGLRRKGKFVAWRLNIPEHIAGQIDLLLFDPVNKRQLYGGRSTLATRLFENYLMELRNGTATPIAITESVQTNRPDDAA